MVSPPSAADRNQLWSSRTRRSDESPTASIPTPSANSAATRGKPPEPVNGRLPCGVTVVVGDVEPNGPTGVVVDVDPSGPTGVVVDVDPNGPMVVEVSGPTWVVLVSGTVVVDVDVLVEVSATVVVVSGTVVVEVEVLVDSATVVVVSGTVVVDVLVEVSGTVVVDVEGGHVVVVVDGPQFERSWLAFA
jgi:hypothetical protein